MALLKRAALLNHASDSDSRSRGGRGYFARRPSPQRLFCLAVLPVVFAASLTGMFGSIPGMIQAVLGLGLIILIHEFGHFAAAKLCDVYVEAFAIGFGPALLSKKVGETEYRLNLLPFGGYVKMLGQDDMDSTQMTSEEVAQDPRAYSAKSVPRRMLIISAGVIMNMITAVFFYVGAFMLGLDRYEPVIGNIHPSMPGWHAGLRPGDRITEMNGKPIANFIDIMRHTTLTSGALEIRGVSADGEQFTKTITPEFDETTRKIGIGIPLSTELIALQGEPPVAPDSAAARVLTEPVPLNTRVTSINGDKVATYFELMRGFSRYRSEPVTLAIDGPEGTPKQVTIDPVPFRETGIRLDVGPVVDVQEGSIAAAEGIKVGDRLAKVDGVAIGVELDPLKLPDYFSDKAGQAVTLRVVRKSDTGENVEQDISITPGDRMAWETPPAMPEAPVTIPSIGLAFNVVAYVAAVEEGSPAAAAGISPGDRLMKATLTPSEEFRKRVPLAKVESMEINEKNTWATVFWTLQDQPAMSLNVAYKDKETEKITEVELTTKAATDWWLPTDRGLLFDAATYEQTASGVGEAFSMSFTETGDKVVEIYRTLKALFTGSVSVGGLRGPLGILDIAKKIAEKSLADFLDFLGYISVNLAVLNFLPIPVLDGGHMVLLAYEAIFRKKPSEKVVIIITQIGLLGLISLFLTTTFFDVSRFFGG